MFKILVVEDDQPKLRDIMQVLSKIVGVDIDSVETEIDAHSAKKRMMSKHYDLLVLDISIPLKREKDIDPDGGLKLLDEILKRDIFLTPVHIIGLTAHENIFDIAKSSFSNNSLTIIKYSLTSDDWQSKLMLGVSQHIAAKDSAAVAVPDYDYDAVYICALQSEMDANRSNGWNWNLFNIANDDTPYYTASYQNKEGREIRIIAGVAARMSMPASAALTMKMILAFRPKYLIMTGIMAGVSSKVKLGDVIVANPIWDWGSGKWTTKVDNEKETSMFLTDPFQFIVDRQILNIVSSISENHRLLYDIRKSYSGHARNEDFSIHVGPVASGASVLSDKAVFRQVNDQHRKLMGVEMEAYGVFSAVESASRPKPLCICLKSVVDYGDKDKDDDYQHYGAYLSAQVAKEIIQMLN